MRSEKEMMDLILGVAQQDERIRAVYMTGSRVNPDAPKDIFQDYDVVYVVEETASFIREKNWIRVFGDLLMLQEPDKNDRLDVNVDFDRSYAYLMLFADGNRLDLRLQTKDAMREEYGKDKLAVPLMDKDGCLPPVPPPTDAEYHVKRPTEQHFLRCCNNFWWCLQNVAKGIWRDELPYAKHMFESVVRVELDEMVSWWIGTRRDFRVSTGKMGKYFKKYLPTPYWEMYRATYSDANHDNFWDSVFAACRLFRTLAKEVADALSFPYPADDDANMTKYLKRVRNLPADATGIFD